MFSTNLIQSGGFLRFLTVSSLAFLSLLGTVGSTAQASADEKAALQADMQWLHLIDAGDYPDAWNSAAKVMQSSVPEAAFAQAIGGVRSPLGAPGTRTLKQVQRKTQLSGAPDGHYVVAQ